MRKSLGIVLAVLLVAAMSVPAMGATLKVSGKYVSEVVYDGGYIYSKNPSAGVGQYVGVDLLNFSTLYLNIDFAEGEVMSAHIPLRLYTRPVSYFDITDGEAEVVASGRVLEVQQNPADNYLFVFKGAPLALSLTDATDGEYFFASFNDPLGLVKWLDTDNYGYATFKAAGQPFGIGFTSYFIATEPTADANATYPRYALGRATYGLASGHTVGAIYAAREEDTGNSVTVNVEGDVTGPLPISEGATFTAALALSKVQTAGVWAPPANAYEVNVAGIAAGNFTLSGNLRAVDGDFDAVAPGPSWAPTDISTYDGRRQLQGEAVTNVNVGGQAVKLTLGDDYRVAYDGELDATAFNKVYGKAEFNPSEPVKVTLSGSYQDFLTKDAPVNDDYRKNISGKVEYNPAENLSVTGEAQWMGANLADKEGSGIQLKGSATVKPVAGVVVEGEAQYEAGEYCFKVWEDEAGTDIVPAGKLGAEHTRLDGQVYAEAKQTFVPAGIKQVDTLLAGLARGVWLSSADAQTTYIGYAEANMTLNDLFSNRIAVMGGKSTEYQGVDHYRTLVHDKFTYTVSSNSTLALGYTYDATVAKKGTLDIAYTVKLGDSTIVLSYGKGALQSSSCTDAFDEDRPWSWLCNAAVSPDTDYYKLKITIPF
ncbi:MAG: hypothetical protein QME92_04075 [Bacillota bacterium]|nr:hypothetical protein [Bacillota bacterium]